MRSSAASIDFLGPLFENQPTSGEVEKFEASREGLLDFALAYEKLGWFVLPAENIKKKPMVRWNLRRDRRPTPQEIREWWKRWPDAQIAIATGAYSGIDVVDVDGPEALDKLISLCGGRIPGTIYQTTGRPEGGRHLFFKHHEHGLKNHSDGFLDLRTTNGIIIAAPSLHKSGRRYTWGKINPIDDGLADLAEWPRELVEYFENVSGSRNQKGGARKPITVDPVPKGERHKTLVRLVGKWISQGLDEKTILLSARGCWENLPDKTDFTIEELETQVRDLIIRYGKLEGCEAVGETTPAGPYHLTDTGNGQRFADQHRENVKYCFPAKCYYVWDGSLWKPDREGIVQQLAKETTRKIYTEAAKELESEKSQKIGKWAAGSESSFRQDAMLKMAQSEPGIPILPEQMDKNRWLFNVQNGTIDLKTGERLPHRRSDLITKIAPVDYNPAATCPRWHDFLDTSMGGNLRMMGYMGRTAGYSMTGDTGEQCLFIFHGDGHNGKSTYLNVIKSILNDYAMQTPFETFTIKKNEGIRNDIARMKAARMVLAIEGGDGKRLDEEVIKQATGSDTITSRFLHKEFFEYKPQYKVFLAANHKPIIYGQDYAIWRRIRFIPFDVTIPPEKRIKDYEKVLLEEKEGILNWMVQGCLEWQRVGLADPEKVKDATQAYRSEMDLLGEFLDELCLVGEDYKTKHGDLVLKYQSWCHRSGEVPCKTKTFAKLMESKGFRFTKPHNVKTWQGIGLRI